MATNQINIQKNRSSFTEIYKSPINRLNVFQHTFFKATVVGPHHIHRFLFLAVAHTPKSLIFMTIMTCFSPHHGYKMSLFKLLFHSCQLRPVTTLFSFSLSSTRLDTYWIIFSPYSMQCKLQKLLSLNIPGSCSYGNTQTCLTGTIKDTELQ